MTYIPAALGFAVLKLCSAAKKHTGWALQRDRRAVDEGLLRHFRWQRSGYHIATSCGSVMSRWRHNVQTKCR
jgi:hypothetical protein